LPIFVRGDKSKQFKFVILPSPFEVGTRMFSPNGINMHTPIQIVDREKSKSILGIKKKKDCMSILFLTSLFIYLVICIKHV
jgi:hypothetical protein